MSIKTSPSFSIYGFTLSESEMAFSRSTAARASASCQRCNRRKKKCDRLLPECDACRSAHVACSFLNDDRMVGSYPITYVQNLENRVRELEAMLSAASTASHDHTHDRDDFLNHFLDTDTNVQSPMTELRNESTSSTSAVKVVPATSTVSNFPVMVVEQQDTLVDGLRLLSLEATAERYLGSASGLSFARLTQSVLRRLTPDKAEFVFSSDDNDDIQPVRELYDGVPPNILFDSTALLDWDILPANSPSLFGDSMLSHLVNDESVLTPVTLPDKSQIVRLTEFYFAHSHTLYPIICRNEFMSMMWRVQETPSELLAQSSLWLFRIWMVLAVGSTSYHTVSLVEESEPVLYYNKAMSYFEAALGHGDIAALEVLMLQVSYSFFNQLGPNTWFLVGVAARLAVGMGLHTSTTYENIPVDVAEHRRRMFYSLYMMDRVVSTALGRPFAIHDRDIDVAPFTAVDDENIKADKIVPHSGLQLSVMAIPLHILALRKIAGEITESVYSRPRKASLEAVACDDVIEAIHKKLIEWRRGMPFPLPDINPQVPHLCSSWFDFNYYAHVVRLYRPSPLCPVLDTQKLKTLTDASSMSIREAMNLRRQNRFAYNWLNLLGIFTPTMSLIYATTVQPKDLNEALKEGTAIQDLDLAIEMFDVFAQKFSVARKIGKMVREVRESFENLRNI